MIKKHVMKKILSIIGCVIVLAASSCTKKYITPNPNQTIYATVNPTDWSLYSDGKSYMASITAPQLGSNISDVGGVIVAISYTDGVYEQIPEVYNGTSLSYTYNQGNLTLYAQSPDGATAVQPTTAIKVKVILVSSN
jgi:hypothetical protein